MENSTPSGRAADSRLDKDIDQALRMALDYLASGRVQLAAMVCQQALEKCPTSARALHIAGLAELLQGRPAQAVEFLQRAADQDPTQPDIRNDLGEALRAQGDAAAAAESFQAAIGLDPNHFRARNNLGVALRQAGRVEEAVAAFRAALALRPEYPEALFNLGVTLLESDYPAEAAEALERAAGLDAENPAVREQAAQAWHALNDNARSLPHLQAWARLRPDDFSAWYMLGGVLQRMGDSAAAVDACRRAVSLMPDHPWARYHLSMALENEEQLEEALVEMEEADRLAPGNAQILMRLALLLRGLKRLDEAQVMIERVLAEKPNEAHALNIVGLINLSRCHWDQASAAFMAAAEARKEMALPLVNMACLYAKRGDHVKRREYFGRALERAPDDAKIRFSYALTQLLLGEWEGGWRNYAFRPNIINDPVYRVLRAPLPRDLRGKRVLVQMDQGLGDELLFLRFTAELKARGAWVVYQPNPKLASFVSRLPSIDMALSCKETPKDMDYRVAVGDLALAVDMRSESQIPPPVRLTPSPGAQRQADRLLEEVAGEGPFIGVTWRGGTSKEEFSQWNVLFKEIALEPLADVLRDVPGRIVILQRKPKPGEIERFSRVLGRPVHDLSPVNEQLEVMLALLSRIEEYVAVSNTNVHLRASAGRASRVLIPHPPDWRWMAGGRSPWYPDIPTYRESSEAGWGPALARLRTDLLELYGAGGAWQGG